MPRLVAWALVLALVTVADLDPSLSLMLMAMVGVVTIISEQRFGWERRLEERGVPSREAWVPLGMLMPMAFYGLIDAENVTDALGDKGPVIAFILSFALLSEGLRRSGFIHYLAYRLTSRGEGDMTRLTLYLFLLSSLLTYFTSNDIVVLTMTPIVVSVAFQARITNAKLLLLSQFVAANTVSMGILIGSPTNLILGRAVNMGFVEYLFLMALPSAIALMGTFVFVTWVNRLVERRPLRGGRFLGSLVGTWSFSPTYDPLHFAELPTFTPQMRRWVALFGVSVLLLAISTATNVGLLAVAVMIAAVSLGSLSRDHRVMPHWSGPVRPLRILPLGIVFFGLTYFVIADAIGESRFVRDEVDDFITDHASSHTPVASWGSIVVSGALVNTMNDLPASALAGEVLPRIDFATSFDRALVMQGALAGLNIATYATPVGALAGIIWFDILRKERAQRLADGGWAIADGDAVEPAAAEPVFDVAMPDRRDLVVYGAATFLAMTAVLGATNFGFVALADLLLGPVSGATEFGSGLGHHLSMAACLGVAALVVLAFRHVLVTSTVSLAHVGELFAVVGRLRDWAGRRRLLVTGLLAAGVILAAGAGVYWAEQFFARHAGRPAPFDDPRELATLPAALVRSGFDGAVLPQTVAGRLFPVALVGCLVTLGVRVVVTAAVRRLAKLRSET